MIYAVCKNTVSRTSPAVCNRAFPSKPVAVLLSHRKGIASCPFSARPTGAKNPLTLAALCLLGLTTHPVQAQGPGFHVSTLTPSGIVDVDSRVTYYDGSDGTRFAGIALPAGATALQFRATGGVTTDGSNQPASADGLYASGKTPYNSTARFSGTYQGTAIGSTTGIDPALFGLFFSPTFSGTPKDSLNFRSDSGVTPDPRTLTSYSPTVNQPFYIGDGYTGDNAFSTDADTYTPPGTIQTFQVPTGAQFLLLGIGADVALADNSNISGSSTGFRVHVYDNAPVPEASSFVSLGLLLALGLGGIIVARRRKGSAFTK